MFITVSMRKQQHRKLQKKHQQSIIKEISYNTMLYQFSVEDQLKKSNGFVTVKQKLLGNKQNKKTSSSSTTLKRGSFSTDKLKAPRPSTTSVFSSKSKSNKLFKSTLQIFRTKNILQDNQTIEERPEQRQSQQQNMKHDRNQKILAQPQHFAKQNFSQLFSEGKSSKKQKYKRKNLTMFDLKIQNIQEIFRKSNKSNLCDLKIQAENDQKNIKSKCWKSFYDQMTKNSVKNQSVTKQKISKLKRIATSHQQRKKMQAQNQIPDIFLQNKKNIRINKSQYQSANLSPRHKSEQQQTPLFQPLKNSSVWTQKMPQFFNFVKGGYTNNQFSNKISLSQYRKTVPKFYILKNTQQAIKQSQQYKKITIQNFNDYKPEEILPFVYVNENYYKLKCKKNKGLLKQVVP